VGFFDFLKTTGKPAPDFSNVQSGGSSTAASTSASTPVAPVARTYVVVPGDSLSKIARQEYGDASAWTRIFEANRDTVTNPDLIHPGQTLRLP